MLRFTPLRSAGTAVCATVVALAGLALAHPTPASAATPLPGGRPNYVVAVVGGGLNAYFSRAAEYTFTAGSGTSGTVSETFWYWDMATFTGDASVNKVDTGYASAGCNTCEIRTPKGFQPGGGASTLSGSYHIDVNGRAVITWTGGQTETWTITAHTGYAQLTLFNSNYNLLYGDGYGSSASFSTGVGRDALVSTTVNEVERTASYCSSGSCPSANNGYIFTATAPVNFGADYVACSSSPCLSLTNDAWRSIFVVDPANGRRVFWQHENQGVDGYTGPCFSTGGGHTWALLQAVDDSGNFAAFVGAEASLNARADGNAVISEVALTL